MPPFYVLGALLAMVAVFVAVKVRTARRRALARVRAGWGTPRQEPAEWDESADEYTHHVTTAGMACALEKRTWDDLNMNDVVCSIDRTSTTLGRQLLHARLYGATAPGSADRIERLAVQFAHNVPDRERAQEAIARLDPTTGQGYWRITLPRAIRAEWWYYFFPLHTVAFVTAFALMFVWPSAFLVLIALALISLFIRAATSRQLIGVRGAYQQVNPILTTARNLVNIAGVHASGDGHAMDNDLRALEGLRRTASWMSREPLDVGEIVASLYEYLNIALLLDANALLFGARALERLRDTLARASAWVGEVDVALNIASLRAEPRGWCIPVRAAAGASTHITAAWHPMVQGAVPNSVALRAGQGLVLTGSNMSGKSTFLRTVGACVVLADALNTCPAESYTGPVLCVRSCIGRTDDLASGRSYYLAEVEAVLAILRQAREPRDHLFLFDELFRGTNTVERLAAGEAVLKSLLRSAEGHGARVIVATHDGELVGMLHEQYVPFHFQETITAEGLTFDFQLRPGPTSTRSALALLELHGAPAELIRDARVRAAELDAKGLGVA